MFGEVSHQICTFHVLKELTQGILRAVAAERRRLARQSKSIQEKTSGLFQGRFLFVQRRLMPSERKQFLKITRGPPQLRKLRNIMDHIYALFDRRCHTQTALNKLKKLCQWVKRFKWLGDTLNKIFTPTLEKALTFLDGKLLPATSNAVELVIKEMKGGLHLGRMQVSQDAERVERSVILPVCAYLLLVHLYGRDQAVDKGWCLFQLKHKFTEASIQDQVNRVDQTWQHKYNKIKEAA